MALMTSTGARFLIDKSALARMPLAPVRRKLEPIIEAGEAATCSVIDLEVLFSVRSFEEHRQTRHRRALAYTQVPMNDHVFERAMDVQGELAKTGRHRLPIPDLLIAAVAEIAGLTVLHYDGDYDTIAEVTNQPMEWVVPKGSI
jgi:predicted nucleic acid-binding protein